MPNTEVMEFTLYARDTAFDLLKALVNEFANASYREIDGCYKLYFWN